MRFSMDVLPRHPLTCAHPVSPAFTLWRNMYCGMRCLNCSTKNGRSGRGPTSTCRRPGRSRAGAAHRCSGDGANGRPASRAGRSRGPRPDGLLLGVHVHGTELPDMKGLAVEAHPSWRYKARPGDVALMSSAMSAMGSASAMSAVPDNTTSIVALQPRC